VALEQGVALTAKWIQEKVERTTKQIAEASACSNLLHDLHHSRLVEFRKESVVFATLLPITFRGTANPRECLERLRTFFSVIVSHNLAR